MARDRKRAKQRQRQRQRQTPARVGAERRPAQDLPLDAPDPLEHSSAEVDIAEAAMADPLAPADELEPDELPAVEEGAEEDDLLEEAPSRPRRRASGDGATGASGAQLPREGNRLVNFLRACWAELNRVQWPDRRAVWQATAVVLVFVLIAGGYLGLWDVVFSRLVNAIL